MPAKARRFQLAATVLFASAMLAACGKPAAPTLPPPSVEVTTPVQRDVPVYLDLVGQAEGQQDVEIRARVEDYLESVNFTEGSFVKKATCYTRLIPSPCRPTSPMCRHG